jgi:putative tryptophan/tyrosine transport system substrate-binding protein
VRRGEFIVLFGAAAAWPPFAAAHSSEKVYKIGVLNAGSRPPWLQSSLRDGLRELGWVEGKNFTFEERYAEDSLNRLTALAAELVGLGVDVIVT